MEAPLLVVADGTDVPGSLIAGQQRFVADEVLDSSISTGILWSSPFWRRVHALKCGNPRNHTGVWHEAFVNVVLVDLVVVEVDLSGGSGIKRHVTGILQYVRDASKLGGETMALVALLSTITSILLHVTPLHH
jgi:hypothetical protein